MNRVRVGVGPLSGQRLPADTTGGELDTLVDAAIAAERCGFDAIWVSEHHLCDDGHLTSPLLMLAALSRVTATIRLGTAVALAPLYDPLRLAEDATLVDNLSKGRLLLGLGAGYRDVELEAFGVPAGERTSRLVECVASLRSMWSDETGRDGAMTLATCRPLGPPILLGGYVERAVRRAGRLGDGWIAPTMSTPALLEQRLSWLDDEGALARPFHVVVNIATVIGDGDPWPQAGPGVIHVEDRYRAWAGRPGLGRRPTHLVLGPAEACLPALAPWRDVLADLPDHVEAHLNLRLHYPGMGRAATVAAVELAGAQLVPALSEI